MSPPSCTLKLENPGNEVEDPMQVTLDLPEELAQYLGRDARSLSRAAIEALVLEGVRSGRLSTAQARRVLGFRSRQQIDAFLKTHGVELPLTLEQVRRDSENALAFSK
jgi:Uncharacterised protein family (UPF0175)